MHCPSISYTEARARLVQSQYTARNLKQQFKQAEIDPGKPREESSYER